MPARDPAAPLTASIADPATATGGDRPGPAAAAPPPAAAGRYVLGDEIARGGMGAVYRATDTAFGREVAVKVLLDRYAPASAAARRFRDEARITGQLQHPGVPPAFDLGALPDGRPFLAMKLIKGDTLDDLLKAAADRGRLVAAFEQVCQAVAYAHAHGVVHRDLKPANVMVGAFGEVQVMDWGLAKVLADGPAGPPADPEATASGTEIRSPRDGDELLTQAGSVLGTPAYMPPEQALGAVHEVDTRSDAFGLGGILAAVLTGRPPFVGDTAETTRVMAARGQVADCFARLDASGADPGLVALAKRCLAPEKADRPADAGEVAGAVAALRQAADDRARRAELDRVKAEGEAAAAEVRAAEQRRRARLRLAVLGLAAGLLAAGGGFAWYSDRQAAAERGRRGRTAEAVGGLLDQAEAALRAGDAAKAGPLLDAADARAGEGGAEAAAGRWKSLRADLRVLVELEKADRYRWTPEGSKLPEPGRVAARYRAALAGFGADPAAAGAEAAAARVAGSAARDRLVAALDFVLWQGQSPVARAALRAADPDPFRDAVRATWSARTAGGAAASPAAAAVGLAALAGRPGAAAAPPGFVAVLGRDRAVPVGVRRELLRAAIRSRPGDLGLLMGMGFTYPLNQRDGADERARWFQAAVAVAPGDPVPHVNLGNALFDRTDLGGAEREYREVIRLDTNYAIAHDNLGNVLERRGDLGGAEREHREAIRLDPNYARAHDNLGVVLERRGDLGGAEREYREAIRLGPNSASAHNSLGWVLEQKGDLDGALACYKEALRLDPKEEDAVTNLPRAERMRPLLPRLPGVLAGTDRPATGPEALGFAELCGQAFQNRFAAAARLYEQAFALDPSLANQWLGAGTHRYDAACYAARAARGDGADTPAEPVGRAALRAKALAWLRADLAGWERAAAATSGSGRQRAAAAMIHWLDDSDLTATRPGLWRIGLPAAERADWDAFWAAVRATLAAAQQQPPPREAAPPPRPAT
jgi:eukaryotic-like serine/threonine-protein kinase